jgi:hypothetical protein
MYKKLPAHFLVVWDIQSERAGFYDLGGVEEAKTLIRGWLWSDGGRGVLQYYAGYLSLSSFPTYTHTLMAMVMLTSTLSLIHFVQEFSTVIPHLGYRVTIQYHLASPGITYHHLNHLVLLKRSIGHACC